MIFQIIQKSRKEFAQGITHAEILEEFWKELVKDFWKQFREESQKKFLKESCKNFSEESRKVFQEYIQGLLSQFLIRFLRDFLLRIYNRSSFWDPPKNSAVNFLWDSFSGSSFQNCWRNAFQDFFRNSFSVPPKEAVFCILINNFFENLLDYATRNSFDNSFENPFGNLFVNLLCIQLCFTCSVIPLESYSAISLGISTAVFLENP